MTNGQERAVLELERLCAAQPGDIEMITKPTVIDGRLVVVVSLRIGAVETRPGGLELREREEFILFVPADFPFERPSLSVAHDRFAGFPHVIWSRGICLYRHGADWNPRAGLYGFFEKLRLWLGKAAINDMDPLDVPLEPPHHVTDFSQAPFVIRANAPAKPGEQWIGFAQLAKHANRVELLGWSEFGENWPSDAVPALAVMLPKPLPLEFPKNGAEFFRELEKQGVDRETVVRYLAYAALLTDGGGEIHIVLGIPMRRSAGGEPRLHIAVWTTSHEFAKCLRLTLREEDDSPTLTNIRKELSELIYDQIAADSIAFCRIFDDRPEIVVARDQGSAASWLSGKRVLLLGCGALGSWVAEIVVRAGAKGLHLIDSGLVKPGLLARQNFTLGDVGSNKATALAARLRLISEQTDLQCTGSDAHRFVLADPGRFAGFDLVIDCTASTNFQLKLERDWRQLGGSTPAMLSMGIDAEAHRCIGVSIPRGAAGGVWDAYLQLQYRLCVANTNREIIEAFYTDRGRDRLFQPEPGCSEPTFAGSTADVMALAAAALNILLGLIDRPIPFGAALSAPSSRSEHVAIDMVELAQLRDVAAGHYRIRTTEDLYQEARDWVEQNNRLRNPRFETGGLLWGLWDDAAEVIWVFDASGPPPDSLHAAERFTCGVEGTAAEHAARQQQTHGLCGFVGMWHTHPGMQSHQSVVDVGGMAKLVSRIGHNQRRSLMLIFGGAADGSTATFYVYESVGAATKNSDLVTVASGEHFVNPRVV